MTSTSLRRLLLGMSLLTTGIINAQTACPPGMIPYGTGSGISTCGYDDSQPQPAHQQFRSSPPRWINQFGAIAAGYAHPGAGAAVNQSSRNAAEQAALAECQSNGGLGCKIETWYMNGCAAMVVGDKGSSTNNAATMGEAIKIGIRTCSAATTNCHVYYSACSLPQRIR